MALRTATDAVYVATVSPTSSAASWLLRLAVGMTCVGGHLAGIRCEAVDAHEPKPLRDAWV